MEYSIRIFLLCQYAHFLRNNFILVFNKYFRQLNYKILSDLALEFYIYLHYSGFHNRTVQIQLEVRLQKRPDSDPKVVLSGDKSLMFFAISIFLFAPEGITFEPYRFWSKVFNISLLLSKSIRPYKRKDQIDNKLLDYIPYDIIWKLISNIIISKISINYF